LKNRYATSKQEIEVPLKSLTVVRTFEVLHHRTVSVISVSGKRKKYVPLFRKNM
jgi:hypothetical protein